MEQAHKILHSFFITFSSYTSGLRAVKHRKEVLTETYKCYDPFPPTGCGNFSKD